MPDFSFNAVSTTANPLPEGSFRTPVQTLGQEDFLKLLVAQMAQQDPMNPVKDSEFIGQMAQFSALEQAKTMQQDMSSLRASAMLGDTVTVADEENKDTGTVTGIVSQVVISKGVPSLFVDGRRYLLSDVLSVQQTSLAALPITEAPKVGTLPDAVESEMYDY